MKLGNFGKMQVKILSQMKKLRYRDVRSLAVTTKAVQLSLGYPRGLVSRPLHPRYQNPRMLNFLYKKL